jgi:hypothetical protein
MLSALLSNSDIARRRRHFAFVPISDIEPHIDERAAGPKFADFDLCTGLIVPAP